MMAVQSVQLSDVAKIDRLSLHPEKIEGGTAYLGMESIESGGRILESRNVEPGELKSSKFRFTKNHILYGKLRPYLAKIAAPDFEGICSTDIIPILPGPDIDKNYLVYFLRQGFMVEYANSRSSGANLPRLSPKELAKFRIPLPPLEEQERIAKILDVADALRAKRRESLAQLDALLQSTFLDMFGDPVTNPMGWAVASFDGIGKFNSGATPSKSRDDYWDGSIPWVSPKDMKTSKLFDAQDHVSQLAFDETNLKLLEPGHLLIVVRGMILAHSFPVASNHVPIAINQDMKGIWPSEKFELFFLKECCRHLKRKILAEVSTAGHGTRRFDAEAMKKIGVLQPPLDLQNQFATITQSIERQKAQQRAHLAELDTLFAALQARAFAGEL